MRKIKMMLLSVLIGVSAVSINNFRVNAEWKETNGEWSYYNNGTLLKDSLFFDKDTGKTYYFDSFGFMAKNKDINGYKIGNDGALISNKDIDEQGTNKQSYSINTEIESTANKQMNLINEDTVNKMYVPTVKEKVDVSSTNKAYAESNQWSKDENGNWMCTPDFHQAYYNTWICTNDRWYYVDGMGIMVRNTWVDNYYVNDEGVCDATASSNIGAYNSQFEFESSTGTLLKYNGSAASVSIPAQINGVAVRYIGENAFFSSKVYDVKIPNTVIEIGRWAFQNCKNLNSVTIPYSVTKIGGCAFAHCNSLSNLVIPASVTSIEYGAFMDCYCLNSITIPASVKFIGKGAFSHCINMNSITVLGNSIIEDYAFLNCRKLNNIYASQNIRDIIEKQTKILV